MKKTLFLTAALLGASFLLSAMPYLPGKSVKVDADLSDPVWKTLPWKGSFYALGTKEKAPVQSRFKTFHDKKYIYFAIECDEPAMAKIRKNPYSHDSGLLWMNDSIEINLVPDSAKVISFFKWIVDTNGAVCDLRAQDDNTGRDKFVANGQWTSSALVKARRGQDKYFVECAIPFGCMDFNNTYTDEWRVHVGRTRWAGGKMELSGSSALPLKTL